METFPRVANSFLFRCVLWQAIHPTAKVSEEVNKKSHSRNTMVQILTLYTDPARDYA